jgi:carboxyl-terminal processing protease
LKLAPNHSSRHLNLTVCGLMAVLLLTFSGQVAKAASPQALYDDVWKLLNTRFLDDNKNGQDWRIWRHRYDANLKTNEDAYVAVETMISSLDDRFTRFLDPEEFAEEGQSIKATLFGIGIQIGTKDDKLLVIAPIEDTPADRAGLKPNDEIMEIDGKVTKGMDVKEAADLIRGAKGTKVKLLVKHDGQLPKLLEVMRDEIKLKSVSVKHPFEMKVPDELGYIKLSSFLSSAASEELLDALVKLKDKQGYIIDLRSNPGGLLSNAITIADFFLAEGGIVSTVDRDGYKEVRKAEPDLVTDKPLVILIDEGSASASEILSGALKDNKRATLVGKRSFGKGLVQEINPLPGGSGINITTQKYLTPNDIDINQKGIAPDIEVAITEADAKQKWDPQYVKALEVLSDQLSLKLVLPKAPAPVVAAATETKTDATQTAESKKADTSTPSSSTTSSATTLPEKTLTPSAPAVKP